MVQWQATVARGGHQWLCVEEEEFLAFWGEVLKERGVKSCLKHIYNLRILLSELVLLNRNQLLMLSKFPLGLGFILSITSHAEQISSQVGIFI